MLVAYHGDPQVKAKYLARVAAHSAQDELIEQALQEKIERSKR